MKNKQDILKLHPMIGRLTPMQWDEIHKAMDAYLNEYKTEQLTLTNVSSRLPDLAECNQASLDYATKKDNPDFFLIKQTFKEGINWALNYITKQK